MKSDSIDQVQARLLAPNDLDERRLVGVLDRMLSRRLDYADLYFESEQSESWHLEEGRVRNGTFRISQGVGVRAIAGERTALAFSDDISLAALTQAADAVRTITHSAGQAEIDLTCGGLEVSSSRDLYPAGDPLSSLEARAKVALLQKIDRMARARDPRVVQVSADVMSTYQLILVARSDGHMATDMRPLVRLSVLVVVEERGRREIGRSGGGGRHDLLCFSEAVIARYVGQAVDRALGQLSARAAPAGTMTVVCGPGWPGLLLHEAVGHGLEGDFNRKGSSAFANLMGQQVAAKGVTVVDDGTIPGLRGSLNIDDEGNPTQRTVLIENGVLTGLMQDMLNARLMSMPLTGNGRRESFASPPMPRMTNTYMLNGDKSPDEIIASVKSGLYAVDFAGGQVDITNGKFVFDATEAYLIEDGKITAPVKGATLIGNGPESLKFISMIGNDLSLDEGIASCGKEGQTVPVGVGQPTLRIDNMTVGGTK
jgi:TldD protein